MISQKTALARQGKLRTKITSMMAKSTSPGLADTTFFARSGSFNETTATDLETDRSN